MTVLSQGRASASEAEPEALLSPFAAFTIQPAASEQVGSPWPERVLESPFGRSVTQQFGADEAEELEEAATEFLVELEDEDFADAVEALVDEAAARHLNDLGSWSAAPTAQMESMLLDWIEPLAVEAERAIDGLSARLAGADLLALSEGDLERLLAPEEGETPAGAEAYASPAFDQFLGGIVSKARKLAAGAVKLAKKGIAAVGKLTPIGILLGRLKGLVRPLLNRVLKAAMGKLPVAVRPIARTLAAKLGLGGSEASEDDVTRLAEQFDLEVTALLLAEAPTDHEASEVETDPGEATDAVAELDTARVLLAEQLVELPPGTSPAREIEQFIPAVLAVRPLVKLGISMIGREKVIGFVSDRIADLIKGMVGTDAARRLSRPLVDVGLRALGFETPPTPHTTLAGEALASTVEGTVLRLLDLPSEALADPLQLDSAVQEAFAEAAAAFMPDQFLRQDLPERETAGEDGAWILLPRSARPRYRHRRFTRVHAVPITRQVARAVPWSDGGTLEAYLLDRGAESWPVNAEVDLYEALPGTQLGHMAAGEGGQTAPQGFDAATELQPLSPEVAGLLLGEPGLGRGPARSPAGATPTAMRPAPARVRPAPGGRFYRVRPTGLGVRRPPRPRRRVAVWFDLTSGRPGLRIAIRLSERQAQQLLTRLDPATDGGKRDLPGALADLKAHYQTALPSTLMARLRRTKTASNAAQAGPTADRVTAAVTTALSGFLTERSHLLAAAARDPAHGVTLTLTFPGVTLQSLGSSLPAGTVDVSPGWARRG